MEDQIKAMWEDTRKRVEEAGGGPHLPPYPWCSKLKECSADGRCHRNPNCGE